jgi:serine/threonine-protein kinase RsbW
MKTELHVPSDLKFLEVVEHWLLQSLAVEVGEHDDWPKQATRWRLVLVEAYSNVVRHAHRDHPEFPVRLTLELQDREIALEVWDQGQGYDVTQYNQPSPEAKQEGGYGWMILNRLMDKVEYQLVDGGNCLKVASILADTVTTK